MMKQRIVILISGRGSNMEAILQSSHSGLLQGKCEIVGVIANKAHTMGLEVAKKYGVETDVVLSKGKSRQNFDRELIRKIDPLNVDWVVLAGFMRILTPLFIQHYPKKIINIHPADTALHQGSDGYLWAWEQCLKETVVTVHYVDEGLDTGAVIGQRKLDLRKAKSQEDVEKLGLEEEHLFYSEMLNKLISSNIKNTVS